MADQRTEIGRSDTGQKQTVRDNSQCALSTLCERKRRLGAGRRREKLDLGPLRQGKSIFDVHAQISDGAFNLSVT